jgi:hypothetical protein
MSDEELLTKIGGEKGLIEDVEFEEVIDGTSNE